MSRQRRLGDHLLHTGGITPDQLHIALRQHASHAPGSHSGPPPMALGARLLMLGFVDEATLSKSLSELSGFPLADPECEKPSADALRLLPASLARRCHALPLSLDAASGTLRLAMSQPWNLPALDTIGRQLPTGCRPLPLLAGDRALERALARHYPPPRPLDALLAQLRQPGSGGTIAANTLSEALLGDAVARRASDIHCEPEHGHLRIRYRIDGVLQAAGHIESALWAALCVRLKVLCGMDITENRSPQDGRFTWEGEGHTIDCRGSTYPTVHGENFVIRLLDRQRGVLPLESLGLRPEHEALLDRILARPEGLTLFTGPTGSGKTTTLYALLARLNRCEVNIMTLEDPVEHPLPGIRQSEINRAARLDFASGVRAMLRQDPDILLIGEIRDADTAIMACRAALTGHRVLATLHSNSAAGAIPRLLDLGLPADLLASTLNGIVAQRLVRRLCPECKQPALPPAADPDSPSPPLWQAGGCPACDGSGYRGRLPLLEILPVNAALADLIARRAAPGDLRQHMQAEGLNDLAEDGRLRLLAGETSLGELGRVIDPAGLIR